VKAVVCATCSGALVNLGYKIPIPLKRNARGWEKLRVQILMEERELQARRHDEKRRRRRSLEREIERLESLPPNAGRTRAVQQLRKELSKVTGVNV
jgi:hypothetical protein